MSIASIFGAWRPVYFWVMLVRFFFGFPCVKEGAAAPPENTRDDYTMIFPCGRSVTGPLKFVWTTGCWLFYVFEGHDLLEELPGLRFY